MCQLNILSKFSLSYFDSLQNNFVIRKDTLWEREGAALFGLTTFRIGTSHYTKTDFP